MRRFINYFETFLPLFFMLITEQNDFKSNLNYSLIKFTHKKRPVNIHVNLIGKHILFWVITNCIKLFLKFFVLLVFGDNV